MPNTEHFDVVGWTRAPKEDEMMCHIKVNVETTVVAGKNDATGFKTEMATIWPYGEMAVEEQLLRLAVEIGIRRSDRESMQEALRQILSEI